VAGGKWQGFQTQPHIDYGDVNRYGPNAPWQQPEKDNVALPDVLFPAVRRIEVPQAAGLGVSVDGDSPSLPSFSPYQTRPQQYVEVLTAACDLADPTGNTAPSHVHRMWRVARLPSTLRPDSPTPDHIKAGLRSYDGRLEELLGGGPPERGYRYVGPAELAVMARQSVGTGTRIVSVAGFESWAGRQSPAELAEPFTYVVGLDGRLWLAPRRSEHVASSARTSPSAVPRKESALSLSRTTSPGWGVSVGWTSSHSGGT
jgi:hypothetical protein